MNPAGGRISGPWLVCSYSKKNLCGPNCEKICWGAEPIETDAPVQEQSVVNAAAKGGEAKGLYRLHPPFKGFTGG